MEIKKTTVKPKTARVQKERVAKVAKTDAHTKTAPSLTLTMRNPKGEEAGTVTLKKEVFGVAANKQLVSQAMRVYLANQREGSASTKTRGEVEGSTRKIYRQKGTGRARHGGIRAPIFVGGGITFGPKPRDFRLDFPKKMKHAALVSALSTKVKEGGIMVLDGFESLAPKTKVLAEALRNCQITKRTLLVVPGEAKDVTRAVKNIPYITLMPVGMLHTYAVVTHKTVAFLKGSLTSL